MFIHSAMPVTNAKGMVNIVPFDISVQKLKLIAVKYHNDPKFRTDMSGQTMQTLIRLSFTVCYSFCFFCRHFSAVRPICCNLRVITAKLGVQNLGLLQYVQTYNVYDIKAKFWCNIYTRNCTSNVANSARNSD